VRVTAKGKIGARTVEGAKRTVDGPGMIGRPFVFCRMCTRRRRFRDRVGPRDIAAGPRKVLRTNHGLARGADRLKLGAEALAGPAMSTAPPARRVTMTRIGLLG